MFQGMENVKLTENSSCTNNKFGVKYSHKYFTNEVYNYGIDGQCTRRYDGRYEKQG